MNQNLALESCPQCQRARNSASLGGTKYCLHCECGFVECVDDFDKDVLSCEDCFLPYASFPLDMTLADDQWSLIHPQPGGVLCSHCIVQRASRIPGVIAVRAVIEIKS